MIPPPRILHLIAPSAVQTSGQQSALLRRLSEGGTLLIVPTGAMERHLRHESARQGLLVRPDSILTLAGLVEKLCPIPAQIPAEALPHLIAEALTLIDPPVFRAIAGRPGIHDAFATVWHEMAASPAALNAAEPEQLAWLLRDTRYGEEFAAIFCRVHQRLRSLGFVSRAEKLQLAAAAIRNGSFSGAGTVMIDGFFTFSENELALVAALSQGRRMEITLPDWSGTAKARKRLRELEFQEPHPPEIPRTPEAQVATAPTLEREVEEIARRLRMEAEQGRAWNDMAVILRGDRMYTPMLRRAFDRFSIPARFHFSTALTEHPLGRFLDAVVGGILDRWSWEAVFHILELENSGWAGDPAADRLRHSIQERIPAQEMAGLLALVRNPGLARFLERLESLSPLREALLPASQWKLRLEAIPDLARRRQPEDGLDDEQVLAFIEDAAARDAFHRSLDLAAALSGLDRPVGLEEFWQTLSALAKRTQIRVTDRRSNVVNVIDAFEARQWSAPFAVVCGLLEGQFPVHHPQNLLFNNEERRLLEEREIHLHTTQEEDAEERLLFDVAVTRGSDHVLLTYPRLSPGGDENLPTFFLEDLRASHRLTLYEPPLVGIATERSAPSSYHARLQRPELLRDRLTRISLTKLNQFLGCPFAFFSAAVLGLDRPPCSPGERLDPRLLGTVAHEVLNRLEREGPLDPLIDLVFDDQCTRQHVPSGYHREALRLQLRQVLAQYLEEPYAGEVGAQTVTEYPVSLMLEGVELTGRIDRVDISADARVTVIDYKYSAASASKLRAEMEALQAIQLPLYALAYCRKEGGLPEGLIYLALRAERGGVAGIHTGRQAHGIEHMGAEDLAAFLATAEEKALQGIQAIFAGDIAVAPVSPDVCRYCDFRDSCRIDALGPQRAAAGAES